MSGSTSWLACAPNWRAIEDAQAGGRRQTPECTRWSSGTRSRFRHDSSTALLARTASDRPARTSVKTCVSSKIRVRRNPRSTRSRVEIRVNGHELAVARTCLAAPLRPFQRYQLQERLVVAGDDDLFSHHRLLDPLGEAARHFDDIEGDMGELPSANSGQSM